jgi:HAD superfamily hydrolase (TIGR01509 family)
MGRRSDHSIRGVLFDLDGTLTYPGALDFPAIKQEMNCPGDTPILEFLETLPPDRRVRLMEILEVKEEEAAERSLSNEGAERCLAALKREGILLGIITRNSLRSVTRVLIRFEAVSKCDFAVVITRDDALPKPHPAGVLEAARRLNIPPQELMVVGDFRFDVIAGKRAGAMTVLLTNNGQSTMEPGDPEPDHVVSRLDEILKIVL